MLEQAQAKIDSFRQRVIELQRGRKRFKPNDQKYSIQIGYKYPEDHKLIYTLYKGSTVDDYDKGIAKILDMKPIPTFIHYEEWDGLTPSAKRTVSHKINLFAEEENIPERGYDFVAAETHAAKMATNTLKGIENLGEIEAKIREELAQKSQISELTNDLAKLERELENERDRNEALENEIEALEKKIEEAKQTPGEIFKQILPLAGMLFQNTGLGNLLNGNNAGQQPANGGMAVLETGDAREPQYQAIKDFISRLNDAELSEFMLLISIFNNEKGFIKLVADQLKSSRSL